MERYQIKCKREEGKQLNKTDIESALKQDLVSIK